MEKVVLAKFKDDGAAVTNSREICLRIEEVSVAMRLMSFLFDTN
jgi:hypothetical protein